MSKDSLSNKNSIIAKFDANHTQSEGRAVGGVLILTPEKLIFDPNNADEKTGAKEFDIWLNEIKVVKKKKKGSGGVSDTLFGGGLRDRLKVRLSDGSQELFVVSNLDEVISDINTLVEKTENSKPTATKEPENVSSNISKTSGDSYCTSCGEQVSQKSNYCRNCGSKTQGEIKESTADQPPDDNDGSKENGQSKPRFPILSVFSALMLIWAGFYSLGASGSRVFDFTLLTTLGILVVPRVRQNVTGRVLRSKGWDLSGRKFAIVIGIFYSFMVFISALLMLGAGGMIGFLTIFMVFVFAIAIVSGVRISRKLRN